MAIENLSTGAAVVKVEPISPQGNVLIKFNTSELKPKDYQKFGTILK